MVNQFQSLKLRLLNVGYSKLDNHWDFDNVISPFTRLYLITKGNAQVYHNSRKFNLMPNHLYLIPSFTYSSYKCDVYHEQFYISFFEELGKSLSIYNFADFKYEVEANAFDKALFERLLHLNKNRTLINNSPEHYDNYETLSTFERKNQELSASAFMETQGILKILLSKFINYKVSLKPKVSKSFSKSVLYYISEHLSQPISVKEMAHFCDLSIDHFSRKFTKTFGVRPSKYVQQKRIERAILLITTTNYSLKKIATLIGYEDYNYFSRIFKKQLSATPSAFKTSQKAPKT
ncbi:helix-turn-helix transcriptional regulator [Tamlana fucoidanivorans]|uniref:AraC family transcriptional regulator n=1 Tax=Allotamlana fucoidanivorans TaxID=2583814 RepID=A0A5C4SHQ3_9FLAO|nr:helix-turn-helix domain-containing protein [Tamlana fucoidanivorans]TNJ43141.1 AraC family transcriptional regulator [Tamlana fucoidanivorans]